MRRSVTSTALGVAMTMMACIGDSNAPSVADAGDASSDASSPKDSGTTPDGDAQVLPKCKSTTPFGAPQKLGGINTAGSEEKPRISADELSLYFERDGELVVATRPNVASAFANATSLSVNGSARETSPALRGDGLLIVFQSDRTTDGSVGGWDLFAASRESTAVDFTSLGNVGLVNTSNHEVDPYLLPNGLVLYWASQGSGAPQPYDIKRGTLIQGGFTASNAAVFAQVNTTTFEEASPVVSADELTLYFSANDRTGGKGSWDVWLATRTSTSDPFGAPINVSELNGSAIDQPGSITADGCRMYLASDRDGQSDIYLAERSK